MRKYQIEVRYTASKYYFIEAEDEWDALHKLEYSIYGDIPLLDYYDVKDWQLAPPEQRTGDETV